MNKYFIIILGMMSASLLGAFSDLTSEKQRRYWETSSGGLSLAVGVEQLKWKATETNFVEIFLKNTATKAVSVNPGGLLIQLLKDLGPGATAQPLVLNVPAGKKALNLAPGQITGHVFKLKNLAPGKWTISAFYLAADDDRDYRLKLIVPEKLILSEEK